MLSHSRFSSFNHLKGVNRGRQMLIMDEKISSYISLDTSSTHLNSLNLSALVICSFLFLHFKANHWCTQNVDSVGTTSMIEKFVLRALISTSLLFIKSLSLFCLVI